MIVNPDETRRCRIRNHPSAGQQHLADEGDGGADYARQKAISDMRPATPTLAVSAEKNGVDAAAAKAAIRREGDLPQPPRSAKSSLRKKPGSYHSIFRGISLTGCTGQRLRNSWRRRCGQCRA